MDNLFQRRATELLREDEAFLAVVSPEPIKHFLGRSEKVGPLFERLVVIRGTPGSGKTTMGRLFEYRCIATLLRNPDAEVHKPLVDALQACGALAEEAPTVLGTRLSMETDYRDFWEFPYPLEIGQSGGPGAAGASGLGRNVSRWGVC